MPITINETSENIAFLILNLVTDNLEKDANIQENEENARKNFGKFIAKIEKRKFSPNSVIKLHKTIKEKLTVFVHMTRAIPGLETTLVLKSKIEPIREKMEEDVHNYFISFSKDTILDLETNSEEPSNDSVKQDKKSKKKRKGKGGNNNNKSRKNQRK
jgi:hypothetical protein